MNISDRSIAARQSGRQFTSPAHVPLDSDQVRTSTDAYRVDVDGLRGIAIALVCLFHVDFALFTGGYVGVDVFFVISGFVITRVLLKDLDNGQLSLRKFFIRRIRRLAPAIAVVLFSCITIFTLIYPPGLLRGFGASLLAQSFFGSNIYFWLTTGYFGVPPESKPLLHTWSLSVEEQFYVFFSVGILILGRFKRSTLMLAVGAALCASFALSVIATIAKPNASFFLLPTRAWELLAGAVVSIALVSFPTKRVLSSITTNIVAAAGLIAIALAAVFYRPTTPFPYIYAALPVAGATALVWSNGPTAAASLLASRPLVLLGKISYSLYLWHWVAIAVLCWMTFGAPTQTQRLAAILSCIPIAYASWRFIETPIRERRVLRSDRAIVLFAAIATAVTALYGFAAYASGGFPWRAQAALAHVDAPTRSPREAECFDDSSRGNVRFCEIGNAAAGKVSFIAVGDSHALSLLPALESLATSHGIRGIFAGTSGCLPFLGATVVRDFASVERCRGLNDGGLQMARDLSIRDVILIARWSYYTGIGPDGAFQPITNDTHQAIGVADSRAVFGEQLRATVNAYAAIGATVHIVLQVPLQRTDPEGFVFRRSLPAVLGGMSGEPDGTIDLAQHRADQRFADEVFRSTPGIRILDFAPLLCPNSGTCLMFANGQSMYFDAHHLSVAGAEFVRPALDAEFARIERSAEQ